MTDKEIIQKAYESIVSKIFEGYYNNKVIGQPNADALFVSQLGVARGIRDSALKNL